MHRRFNINCLCRPCGGVGPALQDGCHSIHCQRVGGVQGVLTLSCGGVAQTCHDDRVVELKEQLVVEEADGEGQEGKVKEEGRGRVKESAPWMVWRWL